MAANTVRVKLVESALHTRADRWYRLSTLIWTRHIGKGGRLFRPGARRTLICAGNRIISPRRAAGQTGQQHNCADSRHRNQPPFYCLGAILRLVYLRLLPLKQRSGPLSPWLGRRARRQDHTFTRIGPFVSDVKYRSGPCREEVQARHNFGDERRQKGPMPTQHTD